MADKQLNVRVPDALRSKIRQEAARTGKTTEIIIAAAMSDFFKSWSAAERENFYKPHQPYARGGK